MCLLILYILKLFVIQFDLQLKLNQTIFIWINYHIKFYATKILFEEVLKKISN